LRTFVADRPCPAWRRTLGGFPKSWSDGAGPSSFHVTSGDLAEF
jgi:hypothetical protein